MKPKSNPFLASLRSTSFAICVSLSVAGLSSPTAHAANTTNSWTLGTSDWNTAGNWSLAHVPVIDGANNETVVINSTTTFPIINASVPQADYDVHVGQTAAGRLDITAGTLSNGDGNYVRVGNGFAGTLNITGSGGMNVGGTSLTSGRLIAGATGTSVIGTVAMNTSGTVKIEDDAIGLLLGDNGTRTGNFTLTTGILQINSVNTTGIAILGGTNTGDANFTMTGGTVNATGGIWMGDNDVNSQGVFDISGGTFTATGTGGVVVVSGSNNNTTQSGQHFIGRGTGQGTFTVSGATTSVTLNGTTSVGFSGTATAGTNGLLTISGGTFTNSGDLRVGVGQAERTANANGTGTFNVSGGIASVGGALRLASGDDAGDVVTGFSTVSGTGTLNVANDLIIAYAGNANVGQMTISTGGAVNVGTTTEKWLKVNQWDTCKGQLTVSGGTLNLNGNSDMRFSVGDTATNGGLGASSVTLSSGAITSYSGNGTGSTTTGELDMDKAGNTTTANNTFNLDGGTLTIQQVISTNNNGTAVFNFNGGLLKAANTSANFVDLGGGAQTAVVKAGGAFIDSNGFNITVVQPLLAGAPSGGATFSNSGAAATITLSGVNTYTGATIVNSGTLKGATANAAANGSLSSTSGITINSGGSLDSIENGLFGFGGTTEKSITVNTGGTMTAAAGVNINVGLVTLNGGIMTNQGAAATWGSWTFRDATDKLAATDDSAVSAVNVFMKNGASIDVASGKTLSFTGTLTNAASDGAGALVKAGAGKLILAGTNTYSGATTINAGTLQIGNGSTTGSLDSLSAITSNAAIVYNRSDSFIAGNAMSGLGTLTKQGAGTLTLTGANTHSGATTVSNGTLAFSTTASSIGSLTVADSVGLSVKAAAAGTTTLTSTSLTLGTSGTTSLSLDFGGLNPTVPQISTGALTLNGTVTLNLLATAGLTTNTYTLVDYTGTPLSNLSNFASTSFTLGHSSGILINNTGNTSVDLSVTAESLVWSGAGPATWTTAATGDNTGANDWVIKNAPHTATNFWVNDATEFNDTYNIGGVDTAVGSTTVDISIANVAPSGVIFNNSAVDYTLYSTGGGLGFGITGAGGISKNGTGRASINTPNSYTGPTVVNAGILTIQNGAGLGASTGVTVASGAALELEGMTIDARPLTLNGTGVTASPAGALRNVSGASSYAGTVNLASNSTIQVNGTSLALSNVVSGASSLTKTGSGTLTLSTTTNTFSGGLVINDGTVSVDANVSLGGAGGTAGAIALNTGSTLKTTNNGTLTNTHAITVGTGSATLNIASTGVNGSGQVYCHTANSLLGSGALTVTGNGALGITGAGNLRVDVANPYNGAMTLQSGGNFEYGVAGAVDNTATIAIGNEGELITVTGVTNQLNVTVNGGTNSVMSFVNGNTGIMSGNVTLNADATVGLRDWYLALPPARSGTMSGIISGVGGLITTRGTSTGTPTLTLTGASTYMGTTTIGANTTLQLGNGATLNDGTIAATAGITNNGTLTYYRFGALSSDRVISGPGTVVKLGAGTQTLTAANTYTGTTTVSAGTLVLTGSSTTSGASINAGTNTTLTLTSATAAGSGELRFNTGAITPLLNLHIDGGGTITMANTITSNSGLVNTIDVNNNGSGSNGVVTLTGNLAGIGNATFNITGGNGYSLRLDNLVQSAGAGGTTTFNPTTGNVSIGSLNSTTVQTKTYVLDGTSSGNAITGVIGGVGTLSVTKSNTSTWTLGGANTYTGVTTISGGTLQLGDGNTGNDGTLAGASVVNDSALVYNRFATTGLNYTGVISGTGSMTKTGPGTQTLSGANTYTGATLVNNGTLSIATPGSLAAGSAVTVGASGTLGGTGTVNGTVSSSGTIAPGVGVGTLNTGTATVTLNGTLAIEVDGASADKLVSLGTITGSTTVTVSLLAGGFTAGETGYVIAQGNDITTANFTPPSGYTVTKVGNQAILKQAPVGGYNTWASTGFGLDPLTDGAPAFDKENDGFKNAAEYIFGGSPISGSDNPKIYSFITDSSDAGTQQELVMTIAVPQGTPAFPIGAPSSVVFDGLTIEVRGSTDLGSFPTTVTPVDPVITGLPTVSGVAIGAFTKGGVTYDYRSFSLDGSNGTPTKGFLQARVLIP